MAAGDGLISMKPTSIVHAGTSASINSDGGVDFTAVTSLSLNGVFTSSFDNYLIVVNGTIATSANINARLRASGTDASGNNYVYQQLEASGSTVSGSRSASTSLAVLQWFDSASAQGFVAHVYGPALAQPTAYRTVTSSSFSGGYIVENAGTHSLSTAYDGITIYPASSNITGTVHVFGYEE